MNKLLNIIVALVFIFTGHLSFSQEMKKYICDGQGKGQGLKFSINYPSIWTVSEGVRPHILRTFEYKNKNGEISMQIYVKKMEQEPTKDEIDFLFQKEYVLSNPSLKVSKVIDFNNNAQIEDIRCMYITLYQKNKVYDTEVHSIVKNNYIYFGRYLIQINFFVISNDQKYETMIQMYNSFNPIFKELMYSLSINSRWK